MKCCQGIICKILEIHSAMTLTCSECEDLFKPAEKFVAKILGKNSAQAYVIIHTDEEEENKALKNINSIPEVKEAYIAFRFYDVLYYLETPPYSILEKVITNAIRSSPHVQTSMTINVTIKQK